MPVELSILLPTYNVDVRNFVRDLHAQASRLPLRYEIRVYEDASKPEAVQLNREIDSLAYVIYQVEPVNLGRSKIRNKLAHDAMYQHLLFIDADSEVPDDSYLKTYFKLLPFDGVLVGASRVSIQDPGPKFQLRWLYGKARESKLAKTRNLAPYTGFVINNVIIPKSIFGQLALDETITSYGHEDTAFGACLEKSGIKVLHIDNPVIHTGLEPAQEYLLKTKSAVSNLYLLYHERGLDADSKLIKSFELLRKSRSVRLFVKAVESLEQVILRNLESSNPSLRLFDLYKLYLFAQQFVKRSR